MFKVYDARGFAVTFANGYRVSVIWSYGSYSDVKLDMSATTSPNAEVAVFDPQGELIPLENDYETVAGWLSPEDVAQLLAKISKIGTEVFDKNNPFQFR